MSLSTHRLRRLRVLLLSLLVLLLVLAAGLAAAIAFGGPGDPAPMPSINNPFKSVDFSDLPPLRRHAARDGSRLAFRQYDTGSQTPRGSVVLVHGSSASSASMHPMARAFAAAGYRAYTLDMRGHGESGPRGQIAYLGQLEDDLVDFVAAVSPPRPATLAGFSAGGGFVLRFAGGPQQRQFQNYLMLAPFVGHEAASYRPDSGGWVKVGLPRVVAVSLLDSLGLRWFNTLPVTRFALNEEARAFLTPAYGYALAMNFRPQLDHRTNLQALRQPAWVLAGADDEAFFAERYEADFRAAGRPVPVQLLPGVGHVPLVLAPPALAAAVQAVDTMNRPPNLQAP